MASVVSNQCQLPGTDVFSSDGLKAKMDELDALWVQYLHLLNTYDEAQRTLSKLMSSGFFHLAQANFKNTSGTRYGQDYFDQRSKALRRVSIREKDHCLSIRTVSGHSADPAHDGHETESQQQPTPPATPFADGQKPEHQYTQSDPSALPNNDNSAQSDQASKSEDPLRWFGVLVPQALRMCQTDFVSAMKGPVIEATDAAKAMRGIEVEVRKLKKEIRKAKKALGPKTSI